MPKKKSSGKHYVSKGERPNVSQKTLNDMRNSVPVATTMVNKVEAWRRGKRVMLTIANPLVKGKEKTNKPFVRVEARSVWGNPFDKKKAPLAIEE